MSVVVGVCGMGSVAQASVCTFNQATGDFAVGANWDDCGGAVPTVGDQAVIPAGMVASLATGRTIASLDAQGKLLITGTDIFTVVGGVTVGADGVVSTTQAIISIGGDDDER